MDGVMIYIYKKIKLNTYDNWNLGYEFVWNVTSNRNVTYFPKIYFYLNITQLKWLIGGNSMFIMLRLH